MDANSGTVDLHLSKTRTTVTVTYIFEDHNGNKGYFVFPYFVLSSVYNVFNMVSSNYTMLNKI